MYNKERVYPSDQEPSGSVKGKRPVCTVALANSFKGDDEISRERLYTMHIRSSISPSDISPRRTRALPTVLV